MRTRSSIRIPFGIQLAAISILLFQPLRAQYFEFNFSEEQTYSNNREGFFAGYINTNNTFIYALNSNYAASHPNRDQKLMLKAYEKSTLVEAAEVPLKGFPENKASAAVYDSLRYLKTIVLQDRVIVFWTRLINTDSTKTEELYAESFKADLKRDQAIRLVYTSLQSVDVRQSAFSVPVTVVAADPAGDILIGSEYQSVGKPVVFRYQLLSGQLKTSGDHRISLPVVSGKTQNGLTSAYDYAQDGRLYIRTNVVLSREEQQSLKKHESRIVPVLTVVQPGSGKTVTVRMRGESKVITDFSYVVIGAKTRVVGFFGDLDKDPTGIDKQGIFYADIASDAAAEVPLNYSYFERNTLNKLFPKTRGGRKKKADPTQEELDTRFDIEGIFPMADGSLVLFFNRKYNFTEISSKSGMDGRNVYDSTAYCEKNNVSAIRMSDDGTVKWTSNFERNTTYQGTDVADLRIISRGNSFYVIYGTEGEVEANPMRRRKLSDFRNSFDYAIFDAETGRAKKYTMPANEENVSKDEEKTLDPNSFVVFDNQFFFSKMIIQQKVGWYVANVLFFPSIYYSILSGNAKSGKGELGTLILMDGKPPRKSTKKPKKRK